MLTHISNNYLGSTVHSDLVEAILKKKAGDQFVYCPLQKTFICNHQVKKNEEVILESPRIFNRFIRFFPLLKTFYSFLIFSYIIRKKEIKPSFVIAHNLWSDGLVAFFYKLITGVPYIVAIRNTDINVFIPKLPHYRWLVRRLISQAESVVFINKAYKVKIKDEYPSIFNRINSCSIIHNGVSEEWFRLNECRIESRRMLQVCFIGSFLDNKNLKNSVLAIEKLRREGMKIKYVAIGGSLQQFFSTTGLTRVPDWIEVRSCICDKETLARYLQESRVFLMPSFRETFGLVYIEALSQGCCIVHSEGEGIDGIFDEQFIKGVDPHSIESISSTVKSLIESYPFGVSKLDSERLLSNFSWEIIADEYLKILKREIR